jgi:hypothetical protein
MSTLEDAIERLKRAVARLELAAEAHVPILGPPDGCQADNPQLKAVAGEMAARVDAALARIGQILGEGG